MSKNVLIIAGESSGELYGALLARALKNLWPDVRIIGVGGERMKEAGVELFSGIAGAFGLAEAIASFKSVRNTFLKTVAILKNERPDVAVLIDYPDFNFRVAKRARQHGVKVLYYVSPQVWAWRRGRVKTIAGIADRIAVILPFEEPIYKAAGMPCEFVGHPVLDDMGTAPVDKTSAKTALGLPADKPLLALLPGSRSNELKRLLPVISETVKKFKGKHPDFGLYMPLAQNMDESKYTALLDGLKAMGVKTGKGNAVEALEAADFAVIASGTAALQSAFLMTPMVVIYKLSPFTYHIVKHMVKIKYITLVNLLLDAPVVAELIQGMATPEGVLKELDTLISIKGRKEEMLASFERVKAMFEGKKPSMRVAEMVSEMAGWRIRPSAGGSL